MAKLKEPLPSDIFSPGQILNNTYEIEGVIGRGGTGEVYLARNQISERVVAIKALNATFSGNADYVELMKREEQMRMIVHDAVVRYTECSRSDQGHVFLVMDYVDGPSLNDVMMERRLEEHELLVVAHRVLEGLQATHAQGIVHRDLSPDNIILRGGQAEKATIIDFGIAKDTAAGARTIVGSDFAGKYEYAAPEQLDGQADARADLYALGASLLSAFRREVPDVGRAPGEIMRVKQARLDTSGLPDRLKTVIDWLAAPSRDDRPGSAAEALERLDTILKPVSGRGRGRKAEAGRKARNSGRKRGALVPVLAVLLLAAAGAAGWYVGFRPAPLPTVAPYTFSAALDADGVARLDGHAPDPEAAAALAGAFAAATGRSAPEDAITLAEGVPSEVWPVRTAELLDLLAPLETFELEISGAQAELVGLAPDTATRRTLAERLDIWRELGGMSLEARLRAGPLRLPVERVRATLDRVATCGPLELSGAPAEAYGLDDPVTVAGDVAAPSDAEAIRAALAPLLGDRGLRLDTTTLNEELCRIRAVLPPVRGGAVSIRLAHGATGEPSLTGVFRTGENPVVDIELPADAAAGWLWVMVVDNTGKVFHVLPNAFDGRQEIGELGTVSSGIRRIRVLWSIEEVRQDGSRLAMEVTEGDYGKSEVIAVVSETPLFDIRRPRDESVSSVAGALEETLEGREEEILGVAARVIDARP